MAGQVLLNISKDEKERARLTSEYKYVVDLQSKTVDAKREGKREGKRESAIEIAKKLLGMNIPIDQIVAATGLTRKEVEDLKV